MAPHREQQLTDPHGFLAVTSLTWLGEQPVSAPGAPGRWRADSRGVVVELAEGEELVVDGTRVTGSTWSASWGCARAG